MNLKSADVRVPEIKWETDQLIDKSVFCSERMAKLCIELAKASLDDLENQIEEVNQSQDNIDLERGERNSNGMEKFGGISHNPLDPAHKMTRQESATDLDVNDSCGMRKAQSSEKAPTSYSERSRIAHDEENFRRRSARDNETNTSSRRPKSQFSVRHSKGYGGRVQGDFNEDDNKLKDAILTDLNGMTKAMGTEVGGHEKRTNVISSMAESKDVRTKDTSRPVRKRIPKLDSCPSCSFCPCV